MPSSILGAGLKEADCGFGKASSRLLTRSNVSVVVARRRRQGSAVVAAVVVAADSSAAASAAEDEEDGKAKKRPSTVFPVEASA